MSVLIRDHQCYRAPPPPPPTMLERRPARVAPFRKIGKSDPKFVTPFGNISNIYRANGGTGAQGSVLQGPPSF